MGHLISLTSEVKSDKVRQVYDSFQLRLTQSKYQNMPELKIINSEVIKTIKQLKIKQRRRRGKQDGKFTRDSLPSNGKLITVATMDCKCAKFKTGLNIVFGPVNTQSMKSKELSSLSYLNDSNLDTLVVTGTWLTTGNDDQAWLNGSEILGQGYKITSSPRTKKGWWFSTDL